MFLVSLELTVSLNTFIVSLSIISVAIVQHYYTLHTTHYSTTHHTLHTTVLSLAIFFKVTGI